MDDIPVDTHISRYLHRPSESDGWNWVQSIGYGIDGKTVSFPFPISKCGPGIWMIETYPLCAHLRHAKQNHFRNPVNCGMVFRTVMATEGDGDGDGYGMVMVIVLVINEYEPQSSTIAKPRRLMWHNALANRRWVDTDTA